MRKSKGSLVFPSNPLARLQELRAEVDAPSNETSNETTNEVSSVDRQENPANGAGLQARLADAGSKEPTSRLNVELRDSLHTRLKTYCAKRKIPIRIVVDAVLEDFLNHSESTT